MCSERLSQLEFRQPRTAEELAALFTLRTRTYQASPLRQFADNDETPFIIDGYDTYSTHVGIFRQDNSEPVAYARLVPATPTRPNKLCHELKSQKPDLVSKNDPWPLKLPSLDYATPVMRSAIYSYLSDRNRPHQRIVETTFLSVAEEYRSPRLIVFLTECISAQGLYVDNCQGILIQVSTEHARYYSQKFGGRPLPGSAHYYCEKARCEAVCLFQERGCFPPVSEARIKNHAADLQNYTSSTFGHRESRGSCPQSMKFPCEGMCRAQAA